MQQYQPVNSANNSFGNPYPQAPINFSNPPNGQAQNQMGAKMHQMQAQMNQLEENMRSKGFQETVMQQQGVFIKQKFELLEALTGCETENRYGIYKYRPDGRAYGTPILKCKEKSSWLARNCLPSGCRGFEMICYDMGTQMEDVVMILRRPYQIVVGPCCRPKMDVFLMDPATKAEVHIGSVLDNFDCCNFSFRGETPQQETRFHLEASCCQKAFWFKCPCDSCQKVTFDVYKGNKEEKLDQVMTKTGQGCCKNMFSDSDNFSVPFEPWMTFHDRCLLIACTLLIDYRMFEESPADKNKSK